MHTRHSCVTQVQGSHRMALPSVQHLLLHFGKFEPLLFNDVGNLYVQLLCSTLPLLAGKACIYNKESNQLTITSCWISRRLAAAAALILLPAGIRVGHARAMTRRTAPSTCRV